MWNIFKFYIFMIAAGLTLNAQTQFLYQKLTSVDGLSQNSIFAIHQDKFGFMWFGTRDGLNKYDGYDIIKYHNEPYNPNSLAGNCIMDILEDDRGNLYISTQSGLSKYLIDKERFETVKLKPGSEQKEPRIFVLGKSKENLIWIGTDHGVFKYNPETNLSEVVVDNKDLPPVHQICEDSDGNLWVAGRYEVLKFNREKNKLESFEVELKKPDDLLTGPILEAPDGLIWIGSTFGIYIARKNSKTILPVQHYYPWLNEEDFSSIKSIKSDGKNIWLGGLTCGIHKIQLNEQKAESFTSSLNPDLNPGTTNISSLYIDKSNALWIGTNGAGLLYHNPSKNNLKLISNKNYNIINQSTRSIFKDKQNNLWIGGYRGLDRLNRESGECRHYSGRKPNPVLSGITVYAIYEDPDDDDILWLGFENDGFDLFSKSTGRCLKVLKDLDKPNLIDEATVNKFIFDGENNIWISSNNGLLKLDRRLNVLKHYHPESVDYKISDEEVRDIYIDIDGNIWAATAFGGVNKINTATDSVIVYNNNPFEINSLISNSVNCCTQDGYGYMWFGTDSGLERFDPEKEVFSHYSIKDGLPNNTIYGILIDGHGNLWVSTNKGISKYDTKNNLFYNLNSGHNLQDREFNSYAYHKAYDGEIFFGGLKGINSIYSDEISASTKYPKVMLTNFKIFNESVNPGELFDDRIVLENTITNTDQLVLAYYQNTISFEFSALNYFDNENIKYSYLMDNFDTDWHNTGSRRFASYAKLPPGNYVFKVKSTNPEGSWSNNYCSLPIIINPPFWKSWYAYTFYTISMIGFVFVLLQTYKTKSRKEREELIRQKEISEKLMRVDKLKDNFLAQVSHEIRTPINSILSFTSLIESELKGNIDLDLQFGFDSISSSGRRIIRTIDLLLNFSEIQSGTYSADLKLLDVFHDILKPVYAEYKLSANKKNLEFYLNNDANQYFVKGDNYSITQIVANLVENAIKYTNRGSIELSLYEKNSELVVEVKDTGIGISKEFLPDLFNAFTQETEGYTRKFEGNGLGLALVKKYCTFNNAEISVKSQKGEGTTFTVSFPRA